MRPFCTLSRFFFKIKRILLTTFIHLYADNNVVSYYNLLQSIALRREALIFAKNNEQWIIWRKNIDDLSIGLKNDYFCRRVGGAIPTRQGRHSKFQAVKSPINSRERRPMLIFCFEVNRCKKHWLDNKQAWDICSSVHSWRVFGDTYCLMDWWNRVSRFSCPHSLNTNACLGGICGPKEGKSIMDDIYRKDNDDDALFELAQQYDEAEEYEKSLS